MKSILYLGAILMIGASIYGFVDYKKTSSSKAFSNLYESKEVNESLKLNEPLLSPAEKTEPGKPGKKNRNTKTNGEMKPDDAKTKLEKVNNENKAPVTVGTTTMALQETNSPDEGKKTKRRKVKTEFFSRAPLRERQEAEVPAPPKTAETKKATGKGL